MVTLKLLFFPLKNGSAGHVRMKKYPKFTFNHQVIGIHNFLSKRIYMIWGRHNFSLLLMKKSLFLDNLFFQTFFYIRTVTAVQCYSTTFTAVQLQQYISAAVQQFIYKSWAAQLLHWSYRSIRVHQYSSKVTSVSGPCLTEQYSAVKWRAEQCSAVQRSL